MNFKMRFSLCEQFCEIDHCDVLAIDAKR